MQRIIEFKKNTLWASQLDISALNEKVSSFEGKMDEYFLALEKTLITIANELE